MPPKTVLSAAALRRIAEQPRPLMAKLRQQAERQWRRRRSQPRPVAAGQLPAPDAQRLLHELQVHQIELELQNTELREARDRVEALLEKYTDLYDFAPVGYLSLDGKGVILEANLTVAVMVGMARSQLIQRPCLRLVAPVSQPVFLGLLKKVFARPGKQVGEVALLRQDGTTFWAEFQAASAIALRPDRCCRVAVSDITALKRGKETQQRLEALIATNQALNREILQRQAAEDALKQSQQRQSQLLAQSHHMQAQLRRLSHQLLRAQEEERKRISRELHDEITQILVSISVHLQALGTKEPCHPGELHKKIACIQKVVAKSIAIIHRFARELRPTMLDDLGLIPALHTLLKEGTKGTKLRVRFTTFAAERIEGLTMDTRTVLYRVAQEALANVIHHARASRVNIKLMKHGDAVCLEIADNGKSFDVVRLLHHKRNQRLGLLGMRERVEMVGGRLSVESTPGEGTTIRAEIPLESRLAKGVPVATAATIH